MVCQQYRGVVNHNCQGPRCVCQRYENGELAAVIMNQGRNNQEREDGYQNTISRNFPNRNANSVQIHPNLNPNYQNPIDLIRNYNRGRLQQQELEEENIYERLDNEEEDDDNEEDDDAQASRNESSSVQNNQNHTDDHTYERIDDRISSCNRMHCHAYKYHMLNHMHNFLSNTTEGARNMISQYDQPRHINLDYSRSNNHSYQNSLSRLGRNCFSTENIVYASTRQRSIPPFVYSNCVCPYCRQMQLIDNARNTCHYCHNTHNRLRYQDAAASFRHYLFQLSRNCKCSFCRGEYPYSKLPTKNALRAAEFFRTESCHCRNPINCATCRNKIPSDSVFGRYLDYQSVNNPLYAAIQAGRLDRGAFIYGQAGPSRSNNGATSNARINDSVNPSSLSQHAVLAANASTSSVSICPVNRRYAERQHTCDDSCIRNQSGNLARICQLLGRCERAECNHGRLSVHWWFVNKWLPSSNVQNTDRNIDGMPPLMDEISREQRAESDSDDS